MRGRIAFDGECRVVRIDEIAVRFKGHPFGGSLFFFAHGVLAEELDLVKARLFHPQPQAEPGGDKIGAGHLGIGLVGKEGDGRLSGNGLGFQQQRAAGAQGLIAVTEHVNGGGAVVDDAHEEEDIKAVREEGEMLDAEQVNMQRFLSGHAV